MTKIFLSVSIILLAVAMTFAQEKRTVEKGKTQKNAQTERPLRITKIPRPKNPAPDKGTTCLAGNIKLRVEFLASGKIGDIQPISESGCGSTEYAIEAARSIKFEPAMKDGKTVTVHKVVVLSFSIS